MLKNTLIKFIESINKLIAMTKKYNIKDGIFKINSYKKWITSIEKLLKDSNIETKTMDNVDEFELTTGAKKNLIYFHEFGTLEGIEELEKQYSANNNTKYDELTKLEKIYGIGPAAADKLYKEGITFDKLKTELKKYGDDVQQALRNIDDTTYLKHLNQKQLIGLKYKDDIEQRIPRAEMVRMETLLQKTVAIFDKSMILTICGSYRRGKESSGDIDVLLVSPKYEKKEQIEKLEEDENPLIKFVDILTGMGFLVAHLTDKGTTKYMGLCRLKNNMYARRIDIRFIAYESYYNALLYFTGSDNLNKQMRFAAKDKGYRLNEYAILEENKKTKELKPIKVNSEEDIFNILGMTYLKPTERDI